MLVHRIIAHVEALTKAVLHPEVLEAMLLTTAVHPVPLLPVHRLQAEEDVLRVAVAHVVPVVEDK